MKKRKTKKSSSPKTTVYQIVTDKITALLASGTAAWRKPWKSIHGTSGVRPMNYKTKRPYSGINFFLLLCEFDNPYFLTFKQVGEMGGKVIKGEKSTPVFYWNWMHLDANGQKVKTREEADKSIPYLRFYKVFNATQIEGIEFAKPPVIELKNNEKIDRCEAIVNGCKNLTLEFINKAKAYYSPSLDVVNMPKIEQFDNSEEYYSTLFHELGHWTGHHSRLDRFKTNARPAAFGSAEYSREELIAEMTSAFLCFDCQIDLPKLLQNQAAYLQGWLNVLKADVKMVVTAAAQAEKAAKFILESNSKSN
jgi:antirestriction protein ArdC